MVKLHIVILFYIKKIKIKIEEKKRREEDRNYILKNNIWNYLKKIDYKEEDEYKEIYDDKKKSLVLLYVMEIQKEQKNLNDQKGK